MRPARALAVMALLACAPAWARADPLGSGIERFFKGDLDGAVNDWVASHESGNRTGRELARLGLKILAKDTLQSGDALAARVYIAHGLELSPADTELEALFASAEADSPFQRGSQTRSLDSSAQRESLIRRVLELDLERRAKPVEGKPPRQPMVGELFGKRDKLDVDELLASLASAESAAAARAKVSAAWHKKRARFRYEQGLSAYYAGDYGSAADHFRQALRLDPALKAAKIGLASCEALGGKRASGTSAPTVP
ncbi:MAG: tetratricopeptide repeat protein [Elusimicrobia bacterium]|nr:tetratricopeptide repeat protein [Elusimicrobiota bacterium]